MNDLNLTKWTEQFFRTPVLTAEQEEFCRKVSPRQDTSGMCERCGGHDVRRYRSVKSDLVLCGQCYLND